MDDQIKETVTENTPTEVPESNQQKNSYEQNIIVMRKKLEAEESARISAEKRLKEIEARSAYSHQTPISHNSTDGDDDIGADPDDYLQVKHFKKNTSKLSSKLSDNERRLQELNDRIERYEAQASLRDIKDFDEVVTDENIATLRRLYPEDVEAVMSSPNLKNKAKAMYNMINKYGIAPKDLKASEEKINKNKSKPVTPGTSGQTPQTPLSKLNDYDRREMTEERRQQILAHLEQVKRGR
jgi:hypothetical protein